jgi:hypothetical protein
MTCGFWQLTRMWLEIRCATEEWFRFHGPRIQNQNRNAIFRSIHWFDITNSIPNNKEKILTFIDAFRTSLHTCLLTWLLHSCGRFTAFHKDWTVWLRPIPQKAAPPRQKSSLGQTNGLHPLAERWIETKRIFLRIEKINYVKIRSIRKKEKLRSISISRDAQWHTWRRAASATSTHAATVRAVGVRTGRTP